ncbi:MAG: FKBP-type peptidyl-prolyl cis-trans isomerase [Gammaproteobacteria bacterium]|nr:FKBP-type peptidyl-prolyl cis-trans isomerase [Gammaproteobacteria bacterium]MDE0271906.1 FKBP-type peptidyl-prolyl cis-trans isomerase [Gammaproteobacteria bacterium]
MMEKGTPVCSRAVMLLAACLMVACSEQDGSEPAAGEAVGLAGQAAEAGYLIGHRQGERLREEFGTSIDGEALAEGLADGLAGAPPRVAESQGQAALEAILAERRAAAGAAGKEFLARNAERAEVEVLSSGLQYEVLVAAEGPTPNADSQVTTHYEGRLIDDTVFDSSIARGSPASFRLNQVIAGWTEALQLMSPGAKWRLFIPSELAYGERGAGQLIGPHATLVFDVELISIDD